MAKQQAATGKTIVFFVTEDWYFCSHRLPLAIAARNAGYSVHVITRVQDHAAEIEAAGLTLHPISLSRRSKNPFTEIRIIWQLVQLYRELRPDVVHHVALKPVLYGSIAARLAGIPAVVNAMAGLGFLFISTNMMARLMRPVVKLLFRFLLNNRRTTVILQNPDDVELLCGSGTVDRERVRLIRGSGVDPDVYTQKAEPDGVPVVLLASRFLWDKGIGEFVSAAESLRTQGADARFVLVGDADAENPVSISSSQLETWKTEGNVEFWGRHDDMPKIFGKVHIVCLPSYREGVPKVLIEAASCGRPIVTTDAPGCREIVVDGHNGLLVPTKDATSLASALRRLLESPELRLEMGAAGRQLVKDRFSLEIVIRETLSVYRSILQ
ncbi:MAG: glycosyltransferase family 4 protein [Gammaproteobacteria bacterium]|nr:glycosyltransferase family 4 protein [Gammaproteobacteria bacterium]